MRVAIVNDLRIATEALRRVVSSQSEHSIAWTAPDGETAVRLCQEKPPDVVLMDLLMPGMNGAEATREIMRRCPCPILVVTATVAGNYALVCEALGHGAFDAVCTPVLGDMRPAEAGAALLAKLANVEKNPLATRRPGGEAGRRGTPGRRSRHRDFPVAAGRPRRVDGWSTSPACHPFPVAEGVSCGRSHRTAHQRGIRAIARCLARRRLPIDGPHGCQRRSASGRRCSRGGN